MVESLISVKYPKCIYIFNICHQMNSIYFIMCMLGHPSLVKFQFTERRLMF